VAKADNSIWGDLALIGVLLVVLLMVYLVTVKGEGEPLAIIGGGRGE